MDSVAFAFSILSSLSLKSLSSKGTFVVLLVLGMGALSYIPTPWEWKNSMKITCALYSAETAFFAVIRIFLGLSKPLIAGAALHNLFEWSIVLHLVAETKNKTQFIRNMQLATFWIITVISLAIMIPNLLVAFLAEQATGIMLDFGMPLMYISQLLNKKNSPQVKNFYMYPAIAHTVHILFTIVPLVVANFFVGTVSWYSSFWNEVVIYISAPVTHLLYIAWSHHVDALREKDDTRNDDGSQADFSLLPPEYRFSGAKKFIGIGFVMGLFMLLGVPALLGECHLQPPLCNPSGPFTGTSVALVHVGYEDVFKELVDKANLVKSARRYKGNIDYKLVQNTNNIREYRFIETWENYDAVKNWIKSPVPRSLFGSTEMKNALNGGSLTNFGSYKNLNSKCMYNNTKVG
jgi:quinol monooxygenase YgiN